MRRNNYSLLTPVETALKNAIHAIEESGWADPVMTNAVVLISQELEEISKFIDKKMVGSLAE